jgi:hypothetical protein
MANKKLTREGIIEKLQAVHGNKFDYSEFVYEGSKSKATIICNNCGEKFSQWLCHLKYCPNCEGRYKKFNSNFIIAQIKEKFGDTYGFDKFIWAGSKTPVILKCQKHGYFEQRVNSLLADITPYCCSNKQPWTTEKFINESQKIHGQLYDYTKTVYKNCRTKVIIICSKHGYFLQSPTNHLHMKTGCPICSASKGERIIEKWLQKKLLTYFRQYRFENCRYKNPLVFDFAIMDNDGVQWLIEFQGEQHYRPIDWSGKLSEKEKNKIFDTDKKRDQIKNQYCQENNLKLLLIPYWDEKNINKILKMSILSDSK